MKKTSVVMLCGAIFAGSVLFANPETADMKNTVAAPEVQQEFDQPDGAAVFLKPDGSFQIFARGTGTYDFDDVDDINDARNEATLKAKANLAKFMKEKLSTEEGFSSQSKKLKTITKNGQNTTSNVTKESAKNSSTVIRNSADALLKGVITLKVQRISRSGESGEVQVTVGVSSKTLKAVGKMVNAMDSTPEQGQGGGYGSSSGSSSRKVVTQEAVSDF